jgi:hypothetical protein
LGRVSPFFDGRRKRTVFSMPSHSSANTVCLECEYSITISSDLDDEVALQRDCGSLKPSSSCVRTNKLGMCALPLESNLVDLFSPFSHYVFVRYTDSMQFLKSYLWPFKCEWFAYFLTNKQPARAEE